ncbi:MAG: 2'-5' RNA ligase [Cardiobacteriaceae bacterium]|nr:2'-5' RNA ligase [Cardiobacteriaceae bacterium]
MKHKSNPHQLFMLLRGHQGSGKTTFAEQQIAAFQHQYPQAKIVWLENDRLMMDKNGIYRFSPEAIERAIKTNEQTFQSALKQAKDNRHQPILIINSNTNQKASHVQSALAQAKKAGLATEVYRLHNFYPNQHHVPEEEVLAAYLRLNEQKVAGEIHVEAHQPISAKQSALLAQMEAFHLNPLPFDASQQTYVTADYLRFGYQRFTRKRSKHFENLSVLKYKREVFYRNLFDEALLEMRGMVIDNFGRIIVRPFKKVFNYSERIAPNSPYPLQLDDEALVDAVVKVNGFLGVCTYVDLPPEHPSHHAHFNRQILYSTTGSLDSDFAHMTKAHCARYSALFEAYPNHTFLFEINDEKDVHIIHELLGETLIGVVEVATGRMWREDELDNLAKRFQDLGVRRPEVLRGITFGALKTLLKTVEHEGFMVFDHHSQALLFKLKSPFYLISKLLGRSNEKSLLKKLDKRYVDEEFYPLIDYLKVHQNTFNTLAEQEKIKFIQDFLRNHL